MKDPLHKRECSLDSSKDHVEKDSETPQHQMLSSLSDGTCKSEGESLVQKGIFLQYRLSIYLYYFKYTMYSLRTIHHSFLC